MLRAWRRSRACAACASPLRIPTDFTPDIVEAIDSTSGALRPDSPAGAVGLDARAGAHAAGYSREEYLEKIDCIREARRPISLSTDIIVGFCGETEEDFEQTLSLLEEVEYDRYSPSSIRRGRTPPRNAWPDAVAEEEKGRRLAVLQEAAAADSDCGATRRWWAQTFEVLVEGYHAARGQWAGAPPATA